MDKIKNWLIKFITFLGICHLTCIHPIDYQLEARFEQAKQYQYHQHKYVHIDPNFSQDQQQLIIEALNVWQKKTYNYVSWTQEPWPENFWNGDLRSPKEIETKICSNHLMIFYHTSEDSIVAGIDIQAGSTITGWAQTTNRICGTEYFLLVPDRIFSDREFKQIAMHEFGHILRLTHDNKGMISSEEKSIMSYRWMRALDGPTDYDLSWLLTINGL